MNPEEIQKRINELDDRLIKMVKLPNRFRVFGHDVEVARIEGEINGLKWVLAMCPTPLDTPNLIEQ